MVQYHPIFVVFCYNLCFDGTNAAQLCDYVLEGMKLINKIIGNTYEESRSS